MKFLQIMHHFRRPVSATCASVRSLPFSCWSHFHRPFGRCKFSSLSNAANSPPPLEPSLTPTFDLVQEFAQVLHNGDLQSVINHPVVAECWKQLPNLDDQQFLAILSNFDTFFWQRGCNLPLRPQNDHLLTKLMYSLDHECCKRFADGDYSRALSILETYHFFLAVHNSKMIQRVLRHKSGIPFFSPEPLLRRYLAFMNQHRLWKVPFKFYQVEYALQSRLDELDVPDICAFLQAYIVTLNRYISNDDLLVKIFAKFTNQLDSIHMSHLLVFLLFANRLMYIYQYETITPHVIKLLHFLNSNFEAYSLTCHVHAATLSTKLLIYRPQYLQKICDAVVNLPEISVDAFLNVGTVENYSLSRNNSPIDVLQPLISTKKVTDISPTPANVLGNELSLSSCESGHSTSLSNSSMAGLFPDHKSTLPSTHLLNLTDAVAFFNCAHLGAQLKPFLESNPVSQYFLDTNPRLYVSTIACLAYVGIFSHLINTFLSKEFLLETFKQLNPYKVPRHIPYLDAAVQIESPNYQGPRLEPKFQNRMKDYMIAVNPKKVYLVDKQTFLAIYKMYAYEAVAREYVLYKYTMHEAASLLSELFGGDDYTHVCRALPHLSGDNLIWCTDLAYNPQKLLPEMKESRTINFDFVDPKQQRWFILVCSSVNIHDKEGAGPMVVCTEVPKVRQMKLLGFQVVEVVHEEWEMMSRDQRISVLKEKLRLPATE